MNLVNAIEDNLQIYEHSWRGHDYVIETAAFNDENITALIYDKPTKQLLAVVVFSIVHEKLNYECEYNKLGLLTIAELMYDLRNYITKEED